MIKGNILHFYNKKGSVFNLCSGPAGPGRVQTKVAMAKRDYLVEAAKQIRMALDSEVNEDYEAAFSYYKNGVDLLLNGVQCKWQCLFIFLRFLFSDYATENRGI